MDFKYRKPFEDLMLNELMEDDEHAYDQPCYWGHRFGCHSVYCHNRDMKQMKCRRTWFTGGDTKDEDCEGFKANIAG